MVRSDAARAAAGPSDSTVCRHRHPSTATSPDWSRLTATTDGGGHLDLTGNQEGPLEPTFESISDPSYTCAQLKSQRSPAQRITPATNRTVVGMWKSELFSQDRGLTPKRRELPAHLPARMWRILHRTDSLFDIGQLISSHALMLKPLATEQRAPVRDAINATQEHLRPSPHPRKAARTTLIQR